MQLERKERAADSCQGVLPSPSRGSPEAEAAFRAPVRVHLSRRLALTPMLTASIRGNPSSDLKARKQNAPLSFWEVSEGHAVALRLPQPGARAQCRRPGRTHVAPLSLRLTRQLLVAPVIRLSGLVRGEENAPMTDSTSPLFFKFSQKSPEH